MAIETPPVPADSHYNYNSGGLGVYWNDPVIDPYSEGPDINIPEDLCEVSWPAVGGWLKIALIFFGLWVLSACVAGFCFLFWFLMITILIGFVVGIFSLVMFLGTVASFGVALVLAVLRCVRGPPGQNSMHSVVNNDQPIDIQLEEPRNDIPEYSPDSYMESEQQPVSVISSLFESDL